MLIHGFSQRALVLLVVLCGVSLALLKCDCTISKCVTSSSNCTAGTVLDQCGCCVVCAKGEGEACGGLNHVEGECGQGMQCMVRDLQSWQNRLKRQVDELVGRCEYLACHTIRCPVGQSCVLTFGIPRCRCPLCRDMIDDEVCGESNGKIYRNECELRREECLTGKKIGMESMPCFSKAASRVVCMDDLITVELTKSYLGVSNLKRVSLADPACVFQQNATHIFQTFALNECGTQVTYTLTTVVYSNVARSMVDPSSIIIRHRSIQVPFECAYSLRSRNKNLIRLAKKGYVGKVAFENLRASGTGVRVRSKRKIVKDKDLAVDVNNAERYLVELKAWWLANVSATAVPSYCYASPVHKDESWIKYSLVDQGCPVENGVTLLESIGPYMRLTVPSIIFRGSRSAGFLVRCKLKVCFAGSPEKRKEMCRPNCNSVSRRRRSVEEAKVVLNLLQGRPLLIT